jgi:hypothetical protein
MNESTKDRTGTTSPEVETMTSLVGADEGTRRANASSINGFGNWFKLL